MGEVYRARDTDLARDVALKIITPAVAHDPERLMRFSREAQVLASLNHPNIAHIYGLTARAGSPDDRALVMELVEGQTLADRLKQGPLSIDDAAAVAMQVADALEAAHALGIIHRDLKPANIKIRPDGIVKVLDFGLAKALEPSDGSALSESTTVTSPAVTRQGTILGTAAYMAPEQARGRTVDKRADIWAFGCVFYEMLTGRRLFDADTVSDTIAAILTQEPAWAALPASTPDGIRRLLRRCLEKDPRRRLRDIGDALIDLEEPTATTASPPVGTRRPLFAVGTAAVVLIAGAAATGWYVGQRLAPSTPALVKQFDVSTPTLKNGARTFVLSPDGAKLAYIAGAYEASQIYVRPFDDPTTRRLEGTLGASSLFFSPDGQWLGFIAGGAIKKVPVDGGPVDPVCTSCQSSGASWTPDDTIVFGTATGGLARIPAGGGTIETITTPDSTKNELRHAWPQVLPDGATVLYTVVTSTPEAYRIAVASLKTRTSRVIVEAGAFARYVPSGHLVYVQGNTLMAAPCDPARLTPGRAVAVLDGVATTAGTGSARFDVALDGTLAFVKAAASDRRTLVWVTRQGVATPIAESPKKAFWHLSLAPDGSRLLTGENRMVRRDVGLLQLSTGAFTLLTSADLNDFPEWSPDGKAVLYSTNAPVHTISRQSVDEGRRPEVLYSSDNSLWVGSITRDQRDLVIMEGSPSTSGDINRVDLAGDRKTAAPVVATRFTEWGGRLSPDEHALAYISNESGRWEVYVQAFPESGSRRQVSTDGGVEVVWARSGRELFYRNSQQLMVVPVTTGPTLTVGAPRLVFEGPYLLVSPGGHGYDVAPGDQRFVMILPGEEEAASTFTIRVRINFFDELRRRAPASQ
jgi:serine/threonine-protein kinase